MLLSRSRSRSRSLRQAGGDALRGGGGRGDRLLEDGTEEVI